MLNLVFVSLTIKFQRLQSNQKQELKLKTVEKVNHQWKAFFMIANQEKDW